VITIRSDGGACVAIDYQSLIDRITDTVDRLAYFTPSDHIDPAQRSVLAAVERQMATPGFDPDEVRAFVRDEETAGRLDRVHALSALHVIACHPAVAEWEEAARLAGEQELAALETGGPRLEANLASVDRHRGVLSFLRGHYDMALDHFARALERHRTPENLTNVLATLLRLGEEREALGLLNQARRSFPPAFVAEVERSVAADPDLALIRTENSR
jgi:tetratricopeptide (TPR) repeat protein